MSGTEIVIEAEVGEFAKNATADVVGRVMRVHGVRCGDLRVFAVNGAGKSVATRAGLCLRVEQLPELRKLVDALVAASADEGAGDEGARE